MEYRAILVNFCVLASTITSGVSIRQKSPTRQFETCTSLPCLAFLCIGLYASINVSSIIVLHCIPIWREPGLCRVSGWSGLPSSLGTMYYRNKTNEMGLLH